MADIMYDVFVAVVRENEAIIGLFDPRYSTVMIVRPVVTEVRKFKTKEDNEGEEDTVGEITGHSVHLQILEPDGAEWLYWHDKFGIIDQEEFDKGVARLTNVTERQKLYELLKKEQGRETDGS